MIQKKRQKIIPPFPIINTCVYNTVVLVIDDLTSFHPYLGSVA